MPDLSQNILARIGRNKSFSPTDVRLSSGQLTTIRLAERGTWLGDWLWVREVRKLTESGHQTAVKATDYNRRRRLGLAMFASDGRRKLSSDICAKAIIRRPC